VALWVVALLLILPIVAWLGISLWVQANYTPESDFTDVAMMLSGMIFGSFVCLVVSCEAELIEGLEITDFDTRLLEATAVALDVDEWGRVYVAESHRHGAGIEDNRSHDERWLLDDLASRTVEDRRAYYLKALAEGRFEDPDHFTRNSDGVVVIEDTDGDDVADRRSRLIAWNEVETGLTAGVEAKEGSIWVTTIPSLHRLTDLDRDGTLEQDDLLATGFGVKTSLPGHSAHGLAWGPDGRIYFSIGDSGYHVELPDGRVLEPTMGPGRGAVFRMNPDGSGLEVFATGLRNPQELAFDDYGNLFTGDNNGDGGDAARIVYVVEGGETGWAMPYQSLAGDYVRGPWVAERLWERQHASQPAWVLPPIGYLGNGPAGFLHYPGMGLPERYADHFFLCDYGYTPLRTGIWSFAVEPKGAGFEVVDEHRFAWSVMATDIDFGWDGRMMATVFDQFGDARKLSRLSHPESLADPRLAALSGIVQQPMAEKTSETLFELLGFPDQRVRLRAQYELAAREEVEGLVARVLDPSLPVQPRLHALWALGQIGDSGLRALAPVDLDFAAAFDDELRAQIARVAGEGGAGWLAPALRAGLGDPMPRVRFFSAQSLGVLGDVESADALVELLRENGDRDVFLRHAAVWALHRMGAKERLWQMRLDESRSVRLALLLVLRLAGDERVAFFLDDRDPLIVVEAARAIYDWPIEGGMAGLAALADAFEPADAEDAQTSQALHRRVIGANLALRTEEGAARLARYAADERQPGALRELALESLSGFADPPPRDLAMGFYRPLPAVERAIVRRVLEREGRALADSSLGASAIEISMNFGVLAYDEEKLLELAGDASADPGLRAASLRGLAARPADPAGRLRARATAVGALEAAAPEVRSAARDLLVEVDTARGVEALIEATGPAYAQLERAHAWRRLGELRLPRAGEHVAAGLARWERGELEEDVALEVIEAALVRDDVPGLARRARAALDADVAQPVEGRRWALAGGDAEAGRRIFQTSGDCQRCHGGGGGHAAGVGPSLAGVGSRGARYVLESLVQPGAEIARGYEQVVLEIDDGTQVVGLLVASSADGVTLDVGRAAPLLVEREHIVSETPAASGMPPMGLGLPPRALRDVIAYVMSLE
jgi:quinoprotein glucose dehydrogenase